MSELTQALGLVAPIYNLALVAVLLFLFGKLFATYKKTHLGYIRPWVFLFIGVLVYVAEAIFVVLRNSGVFNLPYHVQGYFELVMVSMFIYALLAKKERMKLTGGKSLASLPPLENPLKTPAAKKVKKSKSSSSKKSAKKAKKPARKKRSKKSSRKRK